MLSPGVVQVVEDFPLTAAEMGAELRHFAFLWTHFSFQLRDKDFWRSKAVTIKTEDGSESSNCLGRSECCGTQTEMLEQEGRDLETGTLLGEK